MAGADYGVSSLAVDVRGKLKVVGRELDTPYAGYNAAMRTRWVRFSIRELIGVTAFVGVVLAVGMYGTDNEDQEYFVQALAPCLVGIVLVVVLGIAVGSPRKRRNILLAFVGGALSFNTIGMMSIFQFATLPGANWEGTLLDAQLLWALTYGTVLAVGYLCAKITQAVQGYEEQDQGSS